MVVVDEGGITKEEKGEAVRLDIRLMVGMGVALGSLSATPPNKLERLGRSLLTGVVDTLLTRTARSPDLVESSA
jgi:hypothetical protein